MAAAFVKNVASGTVSNANSLTLTVPAAGVASGNVLFIRVGVPQEALTVSSITDTGGNAYAQVVSNNAGTNRAAYLWRASITTGLASGNTIVLSFSAKEAWHASAEEFSGLSATVDGTPSSAEGSSTTPSVATTPTNAIDVVVSDLFINSGAADSFTEDTDTTGGAAWTSLTLVGASHALRGAWKITTSATTQTYDPTLGTTRGWVDLIAAYQETAGGGATPTKSPFRFTLLGVQ